MTHLRWHSGNPPAPLVIPVIYFFCPGERPFNCSMCEKSFRDRSELNRHSRRHTGDLPYKCGTCSKGFLRRERYITHCRIHTGEKPYVCGVCNRGYRDKRELKKHQATHNHGEPGQSSPGSSSSGQQAVVSPPSPPPARPAPAKPVQVTVQAQPAPPPAQQAPAASPSQVATITFSLPTEPVPKAQLGLPQPEQQFVQPLNPAQIALPPSVATALQNLNQKAVKPGTAPAAATAVVMAAPSQAVKQEQQMQILKQVQIVDSGEAGGAQQIFAGGALPPGLIQAGAGSAHPQFFYCIVPGAAVQPYAVEGGAIRVSTGEGQTAQLVTIPSGAFQAAQIPVSSGQTFPQLGQYIIDSAGAASAGASGAARSAQI